MGSGWGGGGGGRGDIVTLHVCNGDPTLTAFVMECDPWELLASSRVQAKCACVITTLGRSSPLPPWW